MAKSNRRKGIMLQADDLATGRLVTIHHWKDGREWGLGVPFEVTAVCLPYLVVKPLNSAASKSVQLDVRRLQLMGITLEYARALRPSPPPATEDSDIPF